MLREMNVISKTLAQGQQAIMIIGSRPVINISGGFCSVSDESNYSLSRIPLQTCSSLLKMFVINLLMYNLMYILFQQTKGKWGKVLYWIEHAFLWQIFLVVPREFCLVTSYRNTCCSLYMCYIAFLLFLGPLVTYLFRGVKLNI